MTAARPGHHCTKCLLSFITRISFTLETAYIYIYIYLFIFRCIFVSYNNINVVICDVHGNIFELEINFELGKQRGENNNIYEDDRVYTHTCGEIYVFTVCMCVRLCLYVLLPPVRPLQPRLIPFRRRHRAAVAHC